ncbi:hypothetical protein MSG28_010111 [Choristoneura fumiferana]|uniref:Uncharacterized protein n=1 Tax=Choristoneura fumiferana TaxID=7141 RepID=A0ACC0KJP7_CHOFU|nr:hypothetical protein MSG28_010111 [Choristoneura fumiferana]
MYKGINTLMQKTADDIGNSNTVFLLTNYSMVTISMLYTGQMAQNEADSMRRALARLYNILVTTPRSQVDQKFVGSRLFELLSVVCGPEGEASTGEPLPTDESSIPYVGEPAPYKAGSGGPE